MENQNPTPDPAPAAPPVQPTPPPIQPVQPPVSQAKKSSPWPWIACGCIVVALIIAAAVLLLGWLAVREVGKKIDKFEPAFEQVKNTTEKFNQETDEWKKKSEELRNSLPDEKDLSGEIPAPSLE